MKRRLPSLSVQILVSMIIGTAFGFIAPGLSQQFEILSTMFIRMVMMIIAPLVFCSLVSGIAGSKSQAGIGVLTVRTFILFIAGTLFSLALGFFISYVLGAGDGMQEMVGRIGMEGALSAGVNQEPLAVRIIPTSVVDAMARGDVLQIVVFAVLFGVALRSVGEKGEKVRSFLQGVTEVMFRFAGYVMVLAPLGAFGAVAAVIGKHGVNVLFDFFLFSAGVLSGLIVLVTGVFPAAAWIFRVPVRKLIDTTKDAIVLAFATASSGVALPKAMEGLEQFGSPRGITSFVLPLGLSFNLTGTTLYLGAAAVFIVQAFGVDMTFWAWMELFLTIFIVSKGVPNVPRGSIVLLTMGLTSFGITSDVVGVGVGILLSIDPLLDMARTGTNTAGNCLVAAALTQWKVGDHK